MGQCGTAEADPIPGSLTTIKQLVCNPQAGDKIGMYINRNHLKQHIITPTTEESQFPVYHNESVPLEHCFTKRILFSESFCIFDAKELNVSFTVKEINKWTNRDKPWTPDNNHKHKQIEAQLKKYSLMASDYQITEVPYESDRNYSAFRYVSGPANRLHNDGQTSEILHVWMSFDASKQLILRAHDSKKLVVTQPNQAVIFISKIGDEDGKNKSTWHAGYHDTTKHTQELTRIVTANHDGEDDTEIVKWASIAFKIKFTK